MSDWQIAANVREFFVELVALQADKTQLIRTQNRKDNLGSGLVEALSHLPKEALGPSTSLSLQTDLETVVLREGWGEKAAFVTTEGFENILNLWSESRKSLFSMVDEAAIPKSHPRNWISRDTTYGLIERCYPKGVVGQPLDPAELEQLVAKLKLNQTKTVGICFLHAKDNPTHELALKEILNKEGFEVFTSHSFEGDERKRAKSTLTQTLCSSHIQNFLKPLTEFGLDSSKIKWHRNLDPVPFGRDKELHIEIYEDRTEATYFEKQKPILKKWLQTTLSSGLFYDPAGWVQVGPDRVGSEPGPVAFGKGLDLCLLDSLLFTHNVQVQNSARIKVDLQKISKAFYGLSRQLRESTEDTSKAFFTLGAQNIAAEIKAQFTSCVNDPQVSYVFSGTFGHNLGKSISSYLNPRQHECLFPEWSNWEGCLKVLKTKTKIENPEVIGDLVKGNP